MEIQFKQQGFQREAARAVTDVFRGQPRMNRLSYGIDAGKEFDAAYMVFGNQPIALPEAMLLENVQAVQMQHSIQPTEQLLLYDGRVPAFSIEMETGTGKTYTYIKTIHELHRLYGWNKYIIVVPSVAIREGVLKSLRTMRKHFDAEYATPLHHFAYDSRQLARISEFASDPNVQVMVINTQAFNATGRDARRIAMQLESFAYRRPIDAIAQTRPILIIDEPQSVLGADRKNKTREGLRQFDPLFTLLYSATHRPDDRYNPIYRLDAVDAYRKRLVKKIEVMGIEQVGTTAGNGYLYLDAVELAKQKGQPPRARITFDVVGKNGLRTATRLVDEGFDLYPASGGLAEYRKGYMVERIDASDGTVQLSSGMVLRAGQTVGSLHEATLRRIQIRCTVMQHLARERLLYRQGIKVLSLFFIDSVQRYRLYDTESAPRNGLWAEIFEEEYRLAIDRLAPDLRAEPQYLAYLRGIDASATHQGYFSVDRTKRMIDSTTKRGENSSGDADAYDLIMRDKERLLSLAEPVRFIFSHSALREGWDNPNVFQICTLKQSGSEIKKRQEVGRGIRLCVNQHGERQDSDVLGERVFDTNILTIIASESYADFSRGLQSELAEAAASRPRQVDSHFLEGKWLCAADGQRRRLDATDATRIMEQLIGTGYVRAQKLTPRYLEDKRGERLNFGTWNAYSDALIGLLDTVFDPQILVPDDARRVRTGGFIADQFNEADWGTLWGTISRKTYYTVAFSTPSLRQSAIRALDAHLRVAEVKMQITTGQLGPNACGEGEGRTPAMHAAAPRTERVDTQAVNSEVTYDLIGELVTRTGLKRRTIAEILMGVREDTFGMFRRNPEEFIIRAANIINEQKGRAIVGNITYHALDACEAEAPLGASAPLKGMDLGAFRRQASLRTLVVVDGEGTETRFAEAIESHEEVEICSRLPHDFHINTPVGRYSPDWAIALREGGVHHVYVVSEMRGSNADPALRAIERVKMSCALRHFATIADKRLRFHVVTNGRVLHEQGI